MHSIVAHNFAMDLGQAGVEASLIMGFQGKQAIGRTSGVAIDDVGDTARAYAVFELRFGPNLEVREELFDGGIIFY